MEATPGWMAPCRPLTLSLKSHHTCTLVCKSKELRQQSSSTAAKPILRLSDDMLVGDQPCVDDMVVGDQPCVDDMLVGDQPCVDDMLVGDQPCVDLTLNSHNGNTQLTLSHLGGCPPACPSALQAGLGPEPLSH